MLTTQTLQVNVSDYRRWSTGQTDTESIQTTAQMTFSSGVKRQNRRRWRSPAFHLWQCTTNLRFCRNSTRRASWAQRCREDWRCVAISTRRRTAMLTLLTHLLDSWMNWDICIDRYDA